MREATLLYDPILLQYGINYWLDAQVGLVELWAVVHIIVLIRLSTFYH